MLVSKLLASKTFARLPNFIRNSGVFNQISKIEKPFPSLGLHNSLERCEEDFDGKAAYIGFTASGITGLWDIATMSMRGVSSCMHWDNSHRHHLVGSVTDPFLGMVYITDNENTPYGISFRRRALVRLVWSPSLKQYRLLLERIYKDTGNKDPSLYLNKDPNERAVLALFKRFLESKVEGKCRVILPMERNVDPKYFTYDDFIPCPESLDKISGYDWSMSDCGLSYRHVDDEFLNKFTKQT